MAGRGFLLLRQGARRLLAPHSTAAAAAPRPGRSSLSLNSSPSPSHDVPRAASSAPSSRAVVAADVAVRNGLAFADPPPAPAQAAPSLLQPRVVIYDGVCHLCHAGVKWVIKADKYKKIKFCCVQSKAAEPYLRVCGLDQEDVLRRFLFVEGLYSYYQGSAAALKVATYLPLPYSALSVLFVIPPPLRDLVYDYVAKRCYSWFGKEEECIVVQDKELLDRFIDRDELLRSDKNDFS